MCALTHQMSPWWRHRAWLLLACALLSVYGCRTLHDREGASPSNPSRSSTTPNSGQALKVLAYSTEPFFYRNAEGEFSGYEYNILADFAATQGRVLDVVLIEDNFDQVLTRLSAGEGNLAVGTITVTLERLKEYDFSVAYFPVLMVLVEPRGQESERAEDLAGKRVATERGSSYEARLKQIPGVELIYDDREFVLFEEKFFRMVADGDADALAVDSAYYLWLAEKYPDLVATLPLSHRQHYGIALRPGDPLCTLLDEHLQELKENGKMREFLVAAFGRWGHAVAEDLSADFDPGND